jgi:FkbM family methyltransferase
MLFRRLIALLRRTVGTDKLLEHMDRIERTLAALTVAIDDPESQAACTEKASLPALVHRLVCRAGEDGVLTCLMNDLKLNIPSGMLLMLRHCLHASLDQPLCYYVETNHLKWMCARLGKGDVAVDIGASGGLLTAALAKTVGPTGRVFAFEPADRAFGILQKMVLFNGLDNTVIEKMAVGSTSGTVKFSEYPFSQEDGLAWRPETSTMFSPGVDTRLAKTYDVPVTTVDEYFGANPLRIKVIKIDVEGFETDVVRGALRTIARDHPIFCIDIHRRVDGGEGDTEAPIRALLAPHGYQFEKLGHVLAAYTQHSNVRLFSLRAPVAAAHVGDQ